VRDLYAGSLSRVDTALFPETFDDTARGHLHSPQRAGRENIRYSGSPIPMNFSESGEKPRPKGVCLVTFNGREPAVELIEAPVFQELITVRGGHEKIKGAIEGLKARGSAAWLELVFDSDEPAGDLRGTFEEYAKGSGLEILIVKNLRSYESSLGAGEGDAALSDFTAAEVFDKLLESLNTPEAEAAELRETFQNVLIKYGDSLSDGGEPPE
jgi:exonuclease SbcD